MATKAPPARTQKNLPETLGLEYCRSSLPATAELAVAAQHVASLETHLGEVETLLRQYEQQRADYRRVISDATPASDMREIAAAEAGARVLERFIARQEHAVQEVSSLCNAARANLNDGLQEAAEARRRARDYYATASTKRDTARTLTRLTGLPAE